LWNIFINSLELYRISFFNKKFNVPVTNRNSNHLFLEKIIVHGFIYYSTWIIPCLHSSYKLLFCTGPTFSKKLIDLSFEMMLTSRKPKSPRNPGKKVMLNILESWENVLHGELKATLLNSMFCSKTFFNGCCRPIVNQSCSILI